jgi:iron complex outermembrane receptor protein
MIKGNTAFSRNEILNFTEYVDDFDEGVQKEIFYKRTNIAFSPSVVASSTIVVNPVKEIEINWSHKYVGKQYLDNTGSNERMLNPFYFSDLSFIYSPKLKLITGLQFNATIYNVFSADYEPNGYTFGYIIGGQRINENFYYPQAGRNFLVGCTVKF